MKTTPQNGSVPNTDRPNMAVGRNQWSHFGVGAPILGPILVGIGMFTGATIWVLTHGHLLTLFFTVLGMLFFCLLVFRFCSFLLGVCKKTVSILPPYQEQRCLPSASSGAKWTPGCAGRSGRDAAAPKNSGGPLEKKSGGRGAASHCGSAC